MADIQRVIKAIDWLIYNGTAKNRRDLSVKMNYSESSFSQILNEKVALSEKFVRRLASMDSRLSANWLLNGKGSMLGDDTTTAILDGKVLTEITELRKLAAQQTEQTTQHTGRLITIIENLSK